MTTRTPHKLTVTMPVGYERGLRSASTQIEIGAGFKVGSLAERWKRC